MSERNPITEYPLDEEGSFIYFEVDEVKSISDDGIVLAEADKQVHAMSTKFSKALAPIRQVANDVIHQIDELAQSPEEVTVEFGLKLNFEAGALITKASTEGNLKVTIKWKKKSTSEAKTDSTT